MTKNLNDEISDELKDRNGVGTRAEYVDGVALIFHIDSIIPIIRVIHWIRESRVHSSA